MKEFLKDNQSWICSVVTIAGVALLNLSDSRYVTKAELAEYRKSQEAMIERVNTSLNEVNQSLALLKEKSNQLADHESRLRIVEKRL